MKVISLNIDLIALYISFLWICHVELNCPDTILFPPRVRRLTVGTQGIVRNIIHKWAKLKSVLGSYSKIFIEKLWLLTGMRSKAPSKIVALCQQCFFDRFIAIQHNERYAPCMKVKQWRNEKTCKKGFFLCEANQTLIVTSNITQGWQIKTVWE